MSCCGCETREVCVQIWDATLMAWGPTVTRFGVVERNEDQSWLVRVEEADGTVLAEADAAAPADGEYRLVPCPDPEETNTSSSCGSATVEGTFDGPYSVDGVQYATLAELEAATGCTVTATLIPGSQVDVSGVAANATSPLVLDGVTLTHNGTGEFGSTVVGGETYLRNNTPLGVATSTVIHTFDDPLPEKCFWFGDLENREFMDLVARDSAGNVIPWDDAWITDDSAIVGGTITNSGGGSFTGGTFTAGQDTDPERALAICFPSGTAEVQFDLTDDVSQTGRNVIYQVGIGGDALAGDSTSIETECTSGEALTIGYAGGSVEIPAGACPTCCDDTNALLAQIRDQSGCCPETNALLADILAKLSEPKPIDTLVMYDPVAGENVIVKIFDDGSYGAPEPFSGISQLTGLECVP